MLQNIQLKNFKCFLEVSVPLRAITIFSGQNGAGKSSIVQALLVLRQSYLGGYLDAENLLWAGDLVDLGGAAEVLCQAAESDALEIRIDNEFGSSDFAFTYNKQERTLAPSRALQLSPIEGSSLLSAAFTYVRAERIGPRKILPASEVKVLNNDIGALGEYVAHIILEHSGEISSADPRFVESARSGTFIHQFNSWLGMISPGSELEVSLVAQADAAIGGFSFTQKDDVNTRTFRATNVGFGLSYCLPVIYALLASKANALVVIENPEAHLHPAGQTHLGRLAALCAAVGVQVIVETHSDHFLNGVRLAVKAGALEPEHCAISYFERQGAVARVESPTIDADGRLSHWPGGFFDQHERNLAALLAPKRSS